jgi:hypothetical protein
VNTMGERYTAEGIKKVVEGDVERLFKPWAEGRPDTWIPDEATKVLVSTGYWLREELERLEVNTQDRITQEGKFHRMSRSYDVYDLAAECMNDVLDGKVIQNRVPHRRWG